MDAKSRVPPVPGPKQSVRSAIEQTYEATAGSASQTRERAAGIFDEIVDRGQDARRILDNQRKRAGKLIKNRGKLAERAIDDVRGAIDQIQSKLRP